MRTTALPHPDPAPGTPKLARYDKDGYRSVGVVIGEEISELAVDWKQAIGFLSGAGAAELQNYCFTDPMPLDSVTLLAPLEDDAEVFCIGLNYVAHREEAAELVDKPVDAPVVFSKFVRSMLDPAADIRVSKSVAAELDWEAELGVVMGRDAIDVPVDSALSYVAGYTIVNDITARDLQKGHQQWLLGKNLPASTPIGPWVVAREFFDGAPAVGISCDVNGVEKQNSNTSKLIHPIAELVSLLSRTVGLRAGDVIATGTPEGVGFKRTPPEYLGDGDVVDVAIEGIGSLSNTIRIVP